MFQQLYEPHPALKGFVNNIMMHEVKFDITKTQCTFSIPPLPEHFLMFFIEDVPDQLASHACLSVRQFERVFQQRIGLAPKHFSRMVRFWQAWKMKERQPGLSWIRIAHECEYFDQMHLIRDFHEFAGVNPSSIEQELLISPVKVFNHLFC
ncbi:MAG: helix-turn-helix domain-containing protein [Flavisolibacter sp.]